MNRKLSVQCVLLILLSTFLSASFALDRDEPVSYAGHGEFFDFYGRTVIVNQKFVRKAQKYYIKKLHHSATKSQRRQFKDKKKKLKKLKLKGKARLYANYRLLDWYIGIVNPDDASRFKSRNTLLRQNIFSSDAVISSNSQALGMAQFKPSQALKNSISRAGLPEPVVVFSSFLGGTQYKADCERNSVPSPPKWLGLNNSSDSSWIFQGNITNTFLGPGGNTKVYTFTSMTPEGLCIALPRVDDENNNIALLGVICMSKATGKACFWDAQVNGIAQTLDLDEEQQIPGPKFSGGIDLTSASLGKCTSCHAGENPFIIHPQTNLGSPKIPTEDLFAEHWYTPMVNPAWPQNDGPSTQDFATGNNNCTQCHRSGGSGGRFPELSTNVTNYCRMVLGPAVGQCSFGSVVQDCNAGATMPATSPGNSSTADHVKAMLAACEVELPPWDQPDPPVFSISGKVVLLRVHRVGTGFGTKIGVDGFIDGEVIVKLDSEADTAFGFTLRKDTNEATHKRMLDTLRDAFNRDIPVRIEYQMVGRKNRVLRRVILSK